MIYQPSVVFTALVLLLRFVHSVWNGNSEGINGSGIRMVDTDKGFNVTDSGGNFTVLTSYLLDNCSSHEIKDLKQAVHDANVIAFAGIPSIHIINQPPIFFIDFSHEAAIDYFGPSLKNRDQQSRTYITLRRASYAERGLGLSDWWNDRYVQLSCDRTHAGPCNNGTFLAFTDNGRKGFKYPLITFCKEYFTKLPDFTTVLKYLDAPINETLRVNSLNIRNKDSTMLHEWIHMSWGSAQICPGGAIDYKMRFGPNGEISKAYKPGKTKLLARRRTQAAANKNDNYVYVSLSCYMRRRYGFYSKYPIAWDPAKSVDDNLADEAREPGNPPSVAALDNTEEFDTDNPDGGPEIDDPLYDASEYPDWYKPIVTASLPTTTPATLPSITPPPAPTGLPSDAQTALVDGSKSSLTSFPAQTSAAPPPPPPPPAAPNADSCDVAYKFFLDQFEVRGKSFDQAKLGNNGDGLHRQIKGCGAVTDCSFTMTPNDPTCQCFASGHLQIGTKACVGRAFVPAGGADVANCQGPG
ncbi:hypothetical protein N7G274_003537 [Stereocaulon virgatum]|uniref:Uncharacterized protein n=1 Tax=Stereocaulon virgatum TaxID=373712 RepID=A0ABR4AGP0_9LECA